MARQFALWTAVLLMIAVVAAAIAPRPEQPTPPVFPAPRASDAPAARAVVDATLPTHNAVEAGVGDIVRLHVDTELADRAHVEGLSASAPVGPGSDGVLEFVADLPGHFAVRLDTGGTRIGVVDIAG
jgi:hypothetical protein